MIRFVLIKKDMPNLDTYNKKRDFTQTSEPKAQGKSLNKTTHSFVVQRHHASRLHYDFRLEIDGALKSWAVPKGPSMNPKDKRLAVQVEDHPLSYGSFEGRIPQGNYGAGTVSIFDEGQYSPLEVKTDKEFLKSWKEGSIKFRLEGKILKGDFALVRMQGDSSENWLLIKHKDDYSTDKPYDSEKLVSDAVKKEGKEFKKSSSKKKVKTPSSGNNEDTELEGDAMLAKLSQSVPDSDDWIYEKKFDGFRAIAKIKNPEADLISRNGNKLNKKFPSIVNELSSIKTDCILDGEIVIEDRNEKSYFQLLQSGEPIPKNLKLKYYVFDIIQLDGNDLRLFPLTERKELLELLIKKYKVEAIEFVPNLKQDQNKVLGFAEDNKWEGIIAKLKESTYQEGKRNGNWLKIKLRNTQEAIICGFTKPEGGRSHFGALVLGLMSNGKLKYIGNCGTGFNEKSLKELFDEFTPLIQKTKPFESSEDVAKERNVTWLKPELVCDVYYSEWTRDEHLRHPVFKGLREDKSAEDTKIEDKEALAMENEKELKFGKKTVNLTNLNKIYWPNDNITKGDLLAYYEEMGDFILPYLKDKPISMNRFPNGIEGQSFFQKDVDPSKIPSYLKTTEVYSESTDKTIDYLLCNDLPSLLYIANLGSIEINPWLSTYKKPEKPEFVVLDLDPNGAQWEDVIAVAHTARAVLDRGDIEAFIKTSGSTGLHIVINVGAKYDYEIARSFVQFIAELVQQEHPDTTSMVRDPKKRKGLIYLDYLQNKEGQTIAAPYSARPKPMATVSTPISWDEVDNDLSIQDFTIFNIYDRVTTINDPWEKIFSSKVDIKKALAKY
ncbi:DNA ligase D [Sphingobacterium sp. 1.A.5]|uniref:DNA ligase D n=2 Tax=Sphingobacterium TaxID=28453 RepID=UPI00211F42AE|nr:DNA ligase D [Sphingobacterium sp. 1.A.5]